ncbi:hypothetical protein [Streptomyces sp. A1-5]|uniref:hypothetical protein n=1 Tax=Streptomyces sp. A1-5 TaxID=2738410 RepID=UPI003FA6A3DC
MRRAARRPAAKGAAHAGGAAEGTDRAARVRAVRPRVLADRAAARPVRGAPARAPAGAALRDLRATADHVTAALFAAELVANAVAHTRGPGPVALVVRARAAGCEVEVHGAYPTPVVGLLAAACDAERTGRAAAPAAGSSGSRSVSARRSSGGGCGWCGG